jgi:hypothetical protein
MERKTNGLKKRVNIEGLEFIIDGNLPKDLVIGYDPDSLVIENGILKFKDKKPVYKATFKNEINE